MAMTGAVAGGRDRTLLAATAAAMCVVTQMLLVTTWLGFVPLASAFLVATIVGAGVVVVRVRAVTRRRGARGGIIVGIALGFLAGFGPLLIPMARTLWDLR